MSRWWDDAGNETAYLHVFEVGDDGRVTFDGRFDEDNFDAAYREFERRYYADEGAAFAEGGGVSTEWLIATNRSDFDRLDQLVAPEMRVENRSRSGLPDRSAADLRASTEQLLAMVASARVWLSAVSWLSPACAVIRLEREAAGQDGEKYEWTKLLVVEVHDGRVVSMCEFDVEDEAAAFAYARERMRVAASRLAVANRASETVDSGWLAIRTDDVDAFVALYSEKFEYDDQRRLGGNPVRGRVELRLAFERVLEQYSHFEQHHLAVRGHRLELHRSRWSDDAGNETAFLHVVEIGDDGRITYDARFDEDDFEGAYRELERRYYAGEGAAFAEGGAVASACVTALNQNDFDRLFGELFGPGLRIENRSRSAFPHRSAAEARVILEELNAMVASARTWHPVVCWLSPTLVVARYERDGLGRDGERYEWTRLLVTEFGNGRLTSMCEFELDDEDAAFAYADERMRATSTRLAVTNRASQVVDGLVAAMHAGDLDAAMEAYSDQHGYDDRRRLSGDPIEGRTELRGATERIFEQYSVFETRTLAVRGERLQLGSSRWSDDSGNETGYLHVFEIGDNGRIAHSVIFDEDDFEGAYRELERRYYAGEGAAFAEGGAVQTDWITAVNRDDLDRLGELHAPEMSVENRSRTGFPDRSASDLRASFAELSGMVASTQTWPSAVCWVSPAWNVTRLEREAFGPDRERYEWTRLLVIELRSGLVMFACEFDLEDEEAAFAYANEQVRDASSHVDTIEHTEDQPRDL
jgi:ketosteroid isomerase-like protein